MLTNGESDTCMVWLREAAKQAMAEARAHGVILAPEDERGLPDDLREEAEALRARWQSVFAWFEAMHAFGHRLPEAQQRVWTRELRSGESWFRDLGWLFDTAAVCRRCHVDDLADGGRR
jgi:hypothetical protein